MNSVRSMAEVVAMLEERAPALAQSALYSDDALALEFARRHHDELRYSHGLDWLHFEDGRWVRDYRLRRYDLARTLCREAAQCFNNKVATRIESASTVNAVLSLARSDIRLNIAADTWDSQRDILNTPGGLVDLRTGMVRQTLPSDLVTKITRTAPIVGYAPIWERFLSEAFQCNDEVIAFLQRLFGYCLTGSTREQKLFFCYGKGANGKSTLLDLALWLLGDYAICLYTKMDTTCGLISTRPT